MNLRPALAALSLLASDTAVGAAAAGQIAAGRFGNICRTLFG